MLCRGVSSFNTFLAEYDSDADSGSEYEYESGIEDNCSTAPPSPSSECSHLSRSGSSGRHRRQKKTLLQRLLLLIMWPLHFLIHIFRLWYVKSYSLKFVVYFLRTLKLKILILSKGKWQRNNSILIIYLLLAKKNVPVTAW